GKYNEGVFKYYNENREVLRKYITSEDDAKMKKLLEETVLIFDFKNARLKITDESSDNSRSFKYSSNIPIFESAIPLFEEFIIDQTKYRQKLIEFLPYSFFTDKSGTLYKEIGTLSTKELEDFISFYNTPRKDDLILVNVGTFFEACKHFKIAQAIPFLKKIVEDSRYRNYERTEALKIISQLGSEIAFLSLIFEKYKVS